MFPACLSSSSIRVSCLLSLKYHQGLISRKLFSIKRTFFGDQRPTVPTEMVLADYPVLEWDRSRMSKSLNYADIFCRAPADHALLHLLMVKALKGGIVVCAFGTSLKSASQERRIWASYLETCT